MAAETQYTANTAMVTISTANSNLDGTGTLGTVMTAASNGTMIETVTIKAQTNTSQGMVRLFIYDGANTILIHEIAIPAITKSSTAMAFEAIVPLHFALKSGWILKAATEKAETFNVIAEGYNWTYYTTSVRAETTQISAYNGATTISTANSNLDGTGTLGTPLVCAGTNGNNILSLIIKSRVNTTAGMIRVFLYDGANTKLWREVMVPAITKAASDSSFYYRLEFPNGFALKNGWSIKVSTQNAETFDVTSEAVQLSYPA